MAPTLRAFALLAAPALAAASSSWTDWTRSLDWRGMIMMDDEAPALRATAAAPARAAPDASAWEPLRQLLQSWEFTQNYAIAVGTAEHGRLFSYEGGKFTMKTAVPTGSSSKWPGAMMFAGVVSDGSIASLDDPVSKYVSWWTKDSSDPRSAVTMRTLLSFTSGFGDGHPGEEGNSRAARGWRAALNATRRTPGLEAHATDQCDQDKGEVVACAKWIYANVKPIGTPGQVYSYNSNHLSLAAAVAMSATGLDIQSLMQKYLIKPYGMSSSHYAGKGCPDFAGSLVTTAEDYESFLTHVLRRDTLRRSISDAAEVDSTPFMGDFYTLYGDYGFGHFLLCFDSIHGMTEKCKQDMIHMAPGAFGFIPIISRKHGYYLQLAAAEIAPTGSYPLSGIPEYLAVALKPHVDAILEGTAPVAQEHLSHSPQFLSMSIADVNYCFNCVMKPQACS